MPNSRYYKNNPTDKIWWFRDPNLIGEFVFSFDKKKKYNLFSDYPDKLTKDEKELFDKENPFWVDFFNGRIENIED